MVTAVTYFDDLPTLCEAICTSGRKDYWKFSSAPLSVRHKSNLEILGVYGEALSKTKTYQKGLPEVLFNLYAQVVIEHSYFMLYYITLLEILLHILHIRVITWSPFFM